MQSDAVEIELLLLYLGRVGVVQVLFSALTTRQEAFTPVGSPDMRLPAQFDVLPHGCRSIRVWQDGQCLETLKGHEGPVQCLLLMPNGDFLSGSNDTTIKLWSKQKCIHTFPGHTDTVRQVTCDPVPVADNATLLMTA